MMGDATENFGIYLTLPERWRKKLEAVADNYVSPGTKGKIQDAVRMAIAATFFPDETIKKETEG